MNSLLKLAVGLASVVALAACGAGYHDHDHRHRWHDGGPRGPYAGAGGGYAGRY